MDDLGLVETVDGLGQCIFVAVAHAAHRRLDTGVGQALGVCALQPILPAIDTIVAHRDACSGS